MVEVVIDRQSDENAVRGYAFYDWGKSAFETSVTTAILPFWFSLLFLEANGPNNDGTLQVNVERCYLVLFCIWCRATCCSYQSFIGRHR